MRYLYVNDQGVKKSLISIIHEDRCLHSLSIYLNIEMFLVTLFQGIQVIFFLPLTILKR